MSTDDDFAIRILVDSYTTAANLLDPKSMASVYAVDAELVRTPVGWQFAKRVLNRRHPSRFEGVPQS